MYPSVKISAKILLALLHGYRKHHVYVTVSKSVNVNSYWDGGSIENFTLVHKNNPRMPLRILEGQTPNTPANPHGSDHVLLPGEIIIQTGVFMGKPATACVHFHSPEDLRKFCGDVPGFGNTMHDAFVRGDAMPIDAADQAPKGWQEIEGGAELDDKNVMKQALVY